MEVKSSSHVPKFGNWDTDDVPYTICFENARELRASGQSFDPNDPDSYPLEPFVPATTTATVISAANGQSVPGDRRRHHSFEDDGPGGDHQRRPRQRDHGGDRNGSSGSERLSSGSDYALLKGPKPREGGVGRKKKNSVEGVSRFPPTTVDGHGGNPNPSFSRARQHEGEMASIPKFGSWDARDPKSGEGYTAIFSKVKMEKQISASNLQAMPPLPNQTKQPISHTSHAQSSPSFLSKICCCLFPK